MMALLVRPVQQSCRAGVDHIKHECSPLVKGYHREESPELKRVAAVAVIALLLGPSLDLVGEELKPWQREGARAGEEILGPDGLKMVWVPAGEFMMGSDEGAADEQPVRRVRISRGFWLAKCEVTVQQWLHYCKEARVLLKAEIITPTDHPMSGVSWHDVAAYCNYYGMMLPTEAQWEWAARGPEGRKYPWGNAWDPKRCCNNDNTGEDGFTMPVGRFADGASWCGALDMAGNLAEWCQDWYSETYYAGAPTSDPQGPDTGTEKVWRGGYCWGDANECRTTSRFGSEPDNDGGSGTLRPCYVP